MQRCCFFGQHSHTLHSLLGLTDIKLKNELSSLVDTTVWVNALQDIRSREKQEKNRISDLLVEIRIRKEEIVRSQTDIDARLVASAELQVEIETAKQQGTIFTSHMLLLTQRGKFFFKFVSYSISNVSKYLHCSKKCIYNFVSIQMTEFLFYFIFSSTTVISCVYEYQ